MSRPASPGFTLMEVLVALIIASLVVGAAMGLISSDLQFASRLERRISSTQVLDAAAQNLMVHPAFLRDRPDSLTLEALPGSPVVRIETQAVDQAEAGDLKVPGGGQLVRVALSHGRAVTHFSLIVPGKEK